MRLLTVRRTLLRIAVALSVAGMGVSAIVPAEAAVTPCVNSPTSKFDGAKTTYQISIYGAVANISSKDPDLCGSTSVAMVWAMVTGTVSGPAYTAGVGWAQVGYGRFGVDAGWGGSGFKIFSQYMKECDVADFTPCTTPVTRFDVVPGSNCIYKTQYKGNTHSIHMYGCGTEISETGFDPTANWDLAWQDQFFGETKHVRTDMPGTNADRVQFTNLTKFVDDSGGTAGITSRTSISDHCRYHYHGTGGTDFEIWTQPLDSTIC